MTLGAIMAIIIWFIVMCIAVATMDFQQAFGAAIMLVCFLTIIYAITKAFSPIFCSM